LSPISVGIIGFGMSARVFHLPLIGTNPLFSLQAVVSSRPDDVHSQLPATPVVASIDEMVKRKPDLIVVTTPTATHYSLVKKALQAGIHVVVEKPFVGSSAHGEELLELAQAQGVLLSVFHNRRWDNGFLTASNLLQEGTLGEPKLFISRFDRYRPVVRSERWRESAEQGGGNLFDLGSHLVDQALHLFGRPDFVWGDVATQRENSAVEDFFEIAMAFGNVRVRLQASSFVQGKYPHIELHGTQGSYRKYGLDPQEDQGKTGMNALSPGWGVEPEESAGIFSTSEGDRVVERPVISIRGSYPAFYQKIAEAILFGGENPVPAQDALEAIRVLERVRACA
jgi:scyllo-inositol 2-dehydrogenase (NADP+)